MQLIYLNNILNLARGTFQLVCITMLVLHTVQSYLIIIKCQPLLLVLFLSTVTVNGTPPPHDFVDKSRIFGDITSAFLLI